MRNSLDNYLIKLLIRFLIKGVPFFAAAAFIVVAGEKIDRPPYVYFLLPIGGIFLVITIFLIVRFRRLKSYRERPISTPEARFLSNPSIPPNEKMSWFLIHSEQFGCFTLLTILAYVLFAIAFIAGWFFGNKPL